MSYAVLNGGKRMRAALVFGAARMASGQDVHAEPSEAMLRTAAAIEFLHSYSLVHDDLPAMDNAETRRGQLSCHIKFDEGPHIYHIHVQLLPKEQVGPLILHQGQNPKYSPNLPVLRSDRTL